MPANRAGVTITGQSLKDTILVKLSALSCSVECILKRYPGHRIAFPNDERGGLLQSPENLLTS